MSSVDVATIISRSENLILFEDPQWAINDKAVRQYLFKMRMSGLSGHWSG